MHKINKIAVCNTCGRLHARPQASCALPQPGIQVLMIQWQLRQEWMVQVSIPNIERLVNRLVNPGRRLVKG